MFEMDEEFNRNCCSCRFWEYDKTIRKKRTGKMVMLGICQQFDDTRNSNYCCRLHRFPGEDRRKERIWIQNQKVDTPGMLEADGILG